MDTPCPYCNQTTPHRIEKYCPKCDKTLPHTAFHRHKGMADGLSQWCKACRTIYRVLERQNLRERLDGDPVFSEQWHRRHAANQARWFAKNPDKAHASSNAYGRTNKPKINKRRRARYAKNPSKPLANSKKRKALRRGASKSDLTGPQWETIKIHYDHRCVYCGRKMKRLTQDHITPVSQGGPDTYSNIVPACQSCNAKKGTGVVLRPIQPLLLL